MHSSSELSIKTNLVEPVVYKHDVVMSVSYIVSLTIGTSGFPFADCLKENIDDVAQLLLGQVVDFA